MTDHLHDDIQQQSLINRYRHRLDDIREWRALLTDTMLTITSHRMDLTGVRGTTDRIPGGDALTMRGPWSTGHTEPDDLPHPDQILREWRETITEQQHGGTWAECWRWHWDHTPQTLETPYAEAWRTDIDALWWRLARLTGNAPEDTTPPMADAEELQRHATRVPDNTRLTLREADRFNPGIENRVKRDRNAERDRANRKKENPTYKCNPERSRYLVADLRQHYGFPLLETPTNIM